MKAKVFIAEIEITEKMYHWKKGDTINVPIISQSEVIANKMIDDKFCGSEYPHYRVNKIVEYSGDFLFNMLIQNACIKEIGNCKK